MANIFNKLYFEKLTPTFTVASKNGMVFKKLFSESETTEPPVITINSTYFDLKILVAFGLKPGTHKIRATSVAPNLYLAESDFSNAIEYKVE